MSNGITRIAVAGVGHVGAPTLDALLATSGLAKPVVLTRDPAGASIKPYADKTTVVKIPAYDDEAAIAQALKAHNIEALVATTGGANGSTQLPIAKAAKAAGVKVFLSAEFGVNFRNLPDDKLHPFLVDRKAFHTTLNELGVPWVSLSNGLFADWAPTPYFGFDVKAHTVTIYGDGKQKFDTTALKDIGRATVLAVLAPLPPAGKGRSYAVAGATASWNDWVAALEKATGAKFNVTYKSASEVQAIEKQPDQAGFFAFLKAAQADGRFLTPADKIDNEAIGFKPTVTIEDIAKSVA